MKRFSRKISRSVTLSGTNGDMVPDSRSYSQDEETGAAVSCSSSELLASESLLYSGDPKLVDWCHVSFSCSLTITIASGFPSPEVS